MEVKDKKWVLEQAKKHKVSFFRLWFVDILGFLKSFSIPLEELEVALESKKSRGGQKNPLPSLEKPQIDDKVKSNQESEGNALRRGRWIGACPDCGSSAIEYEGGCFICKSCGYTECS